MADNGFQDKALVAFNNPQANESGPLINGDSAEDMRQEAAYQAAQSSLQNTDTIITRNDDGSFTFSDNETVVTKTFNFNAGVPVSNQTFLGQFQGIIWDKTDTDDYKGRFTSMDAPYRTDSGEDISFLRIIKFDDRSVNIFPNYGNWYQPGITQNKFKQFIVNQCQIASQEKMQVVETAEDFQVLFFGRKPEMLSISGVLKNTIDNPWSMNMIFIWDELMRGSQLVRNGWILQLCINGNVYYGYPFAFQRSEVSGQDMTVAFAFTLVVKERVSIRGSKESFLSDTVKTNVNKY